MRLKFGWGVCMGAWLGAMPALAGTPEGAIPVRVISAPTLSPDGKNMVFEWCDDLWLASTDGGEAKQVVGHPGRDAYPRISPDGKRLVFSSDRSGSLQVYSTALGGGETVRHTWHTEGNELECLSPDGRRAIVRGARERSGFLATRLMEIDLTAELRERRLFDATAHSAAWSPDGGSVLFCTGGEQLYRKGYQGSRCSRIWRFDLRSRGFTCVSEGPSEERSPLWMRDGKGFYFVSSRNGTANLWRQRFGETPERLTSFEDDGVVTPDLSADGSTLVFRAGLGVFRFRPSSDAAPVPLDLWTREEMPDISTDTREIRGTTSADFMRDPDQMVFSAAGELWRHDAGSETPVRLTHSAAAEEDVSFSPDGAWLYFLSDDGIEANYMRAKLENGALAAIQPVTRGTRTKCRLAHSPDGSKIAWVEGTGDVFTAAAGGAGPRIVFKCWDKPTLDWSPDGRWLALAAEDKDSNRDIWIVAADGGQPPVNLTNHPAFDGSPKWSPDGRFLVFSSRRHESGESRLWRIDFGKRGYSPKRAAPAPRMLDTRGVEPTRVVWMPDSRTLLFQSARAKSRNLYSIQADGGGMTTVEEKRGVPIRVTSRGELLWRVNRTPEILSGGKSTRFPIRMEVSRPRDEVLRLGFRRIWRTLGERYYDATMNGRDWPALRLKYEAAAVAARDSRQFDRVISLLRGELNASHLAFHRSPWPEEKPQNPEPAPTAHPGIVFADDDAPADSPLRIARVIAGSPAAALPHPPRAGEILTRIAGVEVTHRSPLERIFADAAKRPLPVTLRDADGNERVIELRCITYPRARSLDRAERAAATLARVAARQPTAAYLRVPDMSRETLRTLELEIHRSSEAEGMILDLRGNDGGRETDRLLQIFCQPVHAFTIPRDGPTGYPIDRRPAPAWDKPLVVLCDQDTFSNGEIFCHAVKHLGRARLVGRPTAGGVISAVKTEIPDVGELQIPFRGWFQMKTGANLDQRGAQPDDPVDLTPADEDAGRDPQLDKALEVLGLSRGSR